MQLVFRGFIMFIGMCILWQGIVSFFQLPPYILPSPLNVFNMLYIHADLIAHQTVPTVIETLVGLILGFLLAVFSALFMAYFKPIGRWFLPLMIISQAIPTFAIAPLLVIWFGYGMASKIICTILMIFFPIASAFFDGLTQTKTHWLDLAKTLQAKKRRIFFYIRIPAALPSLGSGLKIAAVFAPIGAVIGEWVGASRGLGFLMLNANARMQIDLMYAALFVIVLFSLILYFLVDRLVKNILRRFCFE